MRILPYSWVLVTVLVCSPSTHAQVSLEQSVSNLDALLRGYNLISLGNATFSNSQDTHGGLAVAGNLNLGANSFVVAQSPGANAVFTDPTLYVGGQITTNASIQLQNGYAALPNLAGNWSFGGSNSLSYNGQVVLNSTNAYNNGNGTVLAGSDPRTNPEPADWDWNALANGLIGISTNLAAAPATGTISVDSGGNLTLDAQGISSGVVIFDLDMNRLQGQIYDANSDHNFDFNSEAIKNISIQVPDDAVYVINVRNGTDGDTLFGTNSGINFNAGTNMEQLLWNIVPDNDPLSTDALNLGGGSSFYGTVLAPLVNLGNSGHLAPNGQIVAANYTHGDAELHYVGFEAPVSFSAVPEPGTWGVAALGVAALAMAGQRRRRTRG